MNALAALLASPSATAAEPGAAAPGVPWWLYAIVATAIVAVGAVLLLLATRKSQPGAEVPCPNCGKIMMPDWSRCMFCQHPRAAPRRAALEFVSGPLSGRTVDLDAEVTTIGAAPGSTVTLADAGVSRKHAGIRRLDGHDGGGYELADLGSTNGVYVNGEKVARKRLALGDVIRVGATEMIFKS